MPYAEYLYGATLAILLIEIFPGRHRGIYDGSTWYHPWPHQSRHGYGKDGGNFRNYRVTLSLCDWMFGALVTPEGKPLKYGIPGPNAHWA